MAKLALCENETGNTESFMLELRLRNERKICFYFFYADILCFSEFYFIISHITDTLDRLVQQQ